MTALSMLLLSAALLVAPGAAAARARVRGLGAGADRVVRRAHHAPRRSWRDADRAALALAGAWDLLAACLRAGMPVPVAVRAVADGLDAAAELALRRVAELLALGADLEQAWAPALDCPATARLAKAARRSGRSGSALAESLARLAAEIRAVARDQAEVRAQRAGVLIAGPLGLCFLPAFLAIGVLPVVIGLASDVMTQW